MKYIYKTKGTCSTEISFDLEGNVVSNIVFQKGCNGNLKALSRLADGLTVEQIENKCGTVFCGSGSTSCAHQLSLAVREAYKKSLEK